MGITRLTAATGLAVLGLAAPAAAEPPPVPVDGRATVPGQPTITAGPVPFTPGENLTLTVTGCVTEPRAGRPNEIFAAGEPASFTDVGQHEWTAIGGTRPGLRAGRDYSTSFECVNESGLRRFTLTTRPESGPEETPGPSEPGGPAFRFGHDDVELSRRTVEPGSRLGMKVTCPTEVTATSSAFRSTPEFERDGEVFEGTGRMKAALPAIVTIKITCAGHGAVTYHTRPGHHGVGDGVPRVPKGAPQTGEGPWARPGSGVVIAGAALGGFLLHRRRRTT
ncbi:hypothetical protein [Spirillospora sp. CA-294931]|uniref:hypothetical protein n=1 Tax=Spirillospora sp. CA-294931 TaxID=3240042 RepID=UPI003D8AC4AF